MEHCTERFGECPQTGTPLILIGPARLKVPPGIVMGKMKELHREIRVRVKQLQRGAPPNPRRAVYVQNDANLEMAKIVAVLAGHCPRTSTA